VPSVLGFLAGKSVEELRSKGGTLTMCAMPGVTYVIEYADGRPRNFILSDLLC
jgi:hypothetical protein